MEIIKNLVKNKAKVEKVNAFIERITSELAALKRNLDDSINETNLFEEIFTHAVEAIAIIDVQGKYVLQNHAHFDLIGYSDAELEGATPAIHMGQAPFEYVANELSMNGKFKGIYDITTKSRQTKTIELTAFTIYDEEGIAKVHVGIKKDITERRKAEKALAESESRYKTLFQSNPSMCFIIDENGTVLNVNQQGVEKLGYENEEELLNKDVLTVFYEEDRPKITEQIAQCFANPENSYTWNLRKVKKDGTIIWVSETAKCIYTTSQTRLLINCEDITENVKNTQIIERKAAFEKLLVSLSTNFINMPIDEIEEGVQNALEQIATFLEVDRSAVFMFDPIEKDIQFYAEWCHADLEKLGLNKQAEDVYRSYLYEHLAKHKYIYFPQTARIPENAAKLKTLIGEYQLDSVLAFGMFAEGRPIGVVGFGNIDKPLKFEGSELHSLKIIGQLFANLMFRKQAVEQLNYKLEFENLVSNLATRFINIAPADVEMTINQSLEELGVFFNANKGCIIIRHQEQALNLAYAFNTHPPQNDEEVQVMQKCVDTLCNIVATPTQKGYVHIPKVATSEMTEADKTALISDNVHSLSSVSIALNDQSEGFMSFGGSERLNITEDNIATLKIAGKIFADVIEKQRINNQLLLTQFTQDNAPDPIFWVASDGTFFYVNQALCETFGYSREALMSMKLHQIAGNVTKNNWANYWEMLKSEKSHKVETVYINAAQKHIPVEADLKYLNYFDKEYLCAFVRDISEKKIAEEQQKLQHTFLRKVIDTNPNLIFIKNADGRFELVNKAYAKMLGASVEEIIGKTADVFLGKEHANVTRLIDEKIFNSGTKKFSYERKILDFRTGRNRWYHTLKVPIKSIDGSEVQILGVGTDITDRKETEGKLYAKTLQLAEFTENLKQLHRLHTSDYKNFEELFEDFLQTGCNIFGMGVGIIGCVDEEGNYKIHSTVSKIPEIDDTISLPCEEAHCYRPIQEGKTVYFNNIGKDPIESQSPVYQQFKLETYLGTPIVVNGKTFGTLCFLDKEIKVKPFRSQDIEVLETMANSIGRLLGTETVEKEKAEALQALQTSETRYRAIVEDQTELICRFKKDGSITYINEAFKKYFANHRLETPQPNFFAYLSKSEIANVTRLLNALTPQKPVKSYDNKWIAPTGAVKWQLWSCRANYDENNKFVEYQCVGQDITERKLIEQNLYLKTLELAKFTENLKQLHRLHTSEHANFDELFQDYLQTGCDIFGMSTGVIGQLGNDGEYLIKAVVTDIDGIQANMVLPCEKVFCYKPIKAKHTVYYNQVGLDPEARTTIVYQTFQLESYMGTPIWVNGKIFGTLCFMDPEIRHNSFQPQDVEIIETMARSIGRLISAKTIEEQRKDAVIALQTSETRYRAVVETQTELICRFLENGEITFVNHAFLKFFENSAASSEGSNYFESFDHQQQHSIKEVFEQLSPTHPSDTYDCQYLTKDDDIKWLSWSCNAIYDKEGNFIEYQTVGQDTTERKVTEVKIEQTNKDLAQIAENLKRSNEELQHFAYAASHDLQEPLRMIASYLQLLEKRYEGKLDKEAMEYIDFAVSGAKRMRGLINDLLAYSRVQTGKKPLKLTDLNDVLFIVSQNLKEKIKENDVLIDIDRLPVVMADPSQMSSLFQNLIDNAIKFRRQDVRPIVHVAAEETAEHWEFAISDNGIGIEAEFADKIFIIFQRLHSMAEYSGTGIGLAICKRIVERHQGNIWFESEPGQGTTFYFTLKKAELMPKEVIHGK